jgi:hypothetical protein
LILKQLRRFSPGLASRPVATISPGLASKPVAQVFRFGYQNR